MNLKIERGKTYLLRNGKKVLCVSTEGRAPDSVIIQYESGAVGTRCANGWMFSGQHPADRRDIVAEYIPPKTIYVNEYEGTVVYAGHSEKGSALASAKPSALRKAVKYVEAEDQS